MKKIILWCLFALLFSSCTVKTITFDYGCSTEYPERNRDGNYYFDYCFDDWDDIYEVKVPKKYIHDIYCIIDNEDIHEDEMQYLRDTLSIYKIKCKSNGKFVLTK